MAVSSRRTCLDKRCWLHFSRPLPKFSQGDDTSGDDGLRHQLETSPPSPQSTVVLRMTELRQ